MWWIAPGLTYKSGGISNETWGRTRSYTSGCTHQHQSYPELLEGWPEQQGQFR